jgi:putative membrane protein
VLTTLAAASVLADGPVRTASGVPSAPPEPTIGRLLLHVSPEPAPVLLLVLAAGLYLFGVRRLGDRGDAWSRWRTVSWLGGLVVAGYALIGGVATYDTSLFSAHAVQHMLLGSVAPVPLALGAPITLALRTLPPRPRAVLVGVLHSRVARVLSFPLVGFALFIASLYGLYFTSLYQASMEHPVLHLVLHAHFLTVGCLFYWPIIGVDPVPKLPYWGRLLLLFVTFPVHALWALALFTTDQVFAEGWYTRVGRTWGSSLLNDQHTGAGLMWASGELVGVMVFVALFVQWSRADEREAAREDRRLDRLERSERAGSAAPAARAARGGDSAEPAGADPVPDPAEREAALVAREDAYNAWLARLAAADQKRGR